MTYLSINILCRNKFVQIADLAARNEFNIIITIRG